jgi:hypothetical protein
MTKIPPNNTKMAPWFFPTKYTKMAPWFFPTKYTKMAPWFFPTKYTKMAPWFFAPKYTNKSPPKKKSLWTSLFRFGVFFVLFEDIFVFGGKNCGENFQFFEAIFFIAILILSKTLYGVFRCVNLIFILKCPHQNTIFTRVMDQNSMIQCFLRYFRSTATW